MIHDLRKMYCCSDLSVIFLALSSDPGSYLNDMHPDMESKLSLENINRSILFDRNLSTNILLHRPKRLKLEDANKFEMILTLSEFIFRATPFIYWVLSEYLGFKNYLKIIEYASNSFFYDIKGCYYAISSSNAILAINSIKRAAQYLMLQDQFLIDALDLCLTHEVAKRLHRKGSEKTADLPSYLTLNQDRTFASSYNFEKVLSFIYLKQSLSRSMISEMSNKIDPSVYLFVGEKCTRLPLDELMLLEAFNGLNDTRSVISDLQSLTGLNSFYIEERIRRLHEEGVLIDS